MHIDQTWRIVLNDLKAKGRVTDREYRTWLEPTRLLELDAEEGKAVVGAPDTFAVENLAKKYRDKITTCLTTLVRKPVTVEFSVLKRHPAGDRGARQEGGDGGESDRRQGR